MFQALVNDVLDFINHFYFCESRQDPDLLTVPSHEHESHAMQVLWSLIEKSLLREGSANFMLTQFLFSVKLLRRDTSNLTQLRFKQ